MRFYDIRLLPQGAGPGAQAEYDSGEPFALAEALGRGVSLRTAQRVRGKDLGLLKIGSGYELTVATPTSGRCSTFPHETLEGALKQIRELDELSPLEKDAGEA